VQYEGEEESQNVCYTAEAVNQQATPAVDYYLAEGKKKFYLLGTDYVYPQTTNLVLLEYLLSKGVPLANIGGGFRKDGSGKIISAGKYTPFGHTDYQQIVAEIKQFRRLRRRLRDLTLNGDTNVPFFKEYAAAGLTAETCPVVSFSISEDEFRGLPAAKLVGQLGCWTYFQSIDTPANKKFVADFQAWLKTSSDRHREGRPRHVLPDGAELRRRLPLESLRREGRHLRCGQGAQGLEIRYLLRRPRRQGHHAAEHAPHQERLHRRDQGRRPVQDPEDPSPTSMASPGQG
jgi:hypothetical protein